MTEIAYYFPSIGSVPLVLVSSKRLILQWSLIGTALQPEEKPEECLCRITKKFLPQAQLRNFGETKSVRLRTGYQIYFLDATLKRIDRTAPQMAVVWVGRQELVESKLPRNLFPLHVLTRQFLKAIRTDAPVSVSATD